MDGTFLAINRQPLELESCSKSLRIREVFQFRLKKHFSVLSLGFSMGDVKICGVFEYLGN